MAKLFYLWQTVSKKGQLATKGIREFPKARVIEFRFFLKPYFSFVPTTTSEARERCLDQQTNRSTIKSVPEIVTH